MTERPDPERGSDAAEPAPDRPRTIARLVYDTAAQPLPAGVRAVLQRARHLLFVCEGLEVVLQLSVARSRDELKLLGQVLAEGLPAAGRSVRLDGPTGPLDRATDHRGEFRFSELRPGSYSIVVDMGPRLVELPRLELEAPC